MCNNDIPSSFISEYAINYNESDLYDFYKEN